MRIIICALLLLAIQGSTNGKPLLGSIIDTMHDIGCKIHEDGTCQPESQSQSQSTEQNQPQKTSFLGTVKQKVHGAVHKIGCAIKTHEGCLEPNTTETPSSIEENQSFLGTVQEKVHGAVRKIGCAIKTHEGCLDPPTTPSSRKDILSLIDIRIDEGNSTTSTANNENVVFSSSDEIENKTAPKAIITVPHNCPSGFRLDRQNRCRQIE